MVWECFVGAGGPFIGPGRRGGGRPAVMAAARWSFNGGAFSGFDSAPREGERRGQAGSDEGEKCGAVSGRGGGAGRCARELAAAARWRRPEVEDDRERGPSWARWAEALGWLGQAKRPKLAGPARFRERK